MDYVLCTLNINGIDFEIHSYEKELTIQILKSTVPSHWRFSIIEQMANNPNHSNYSCTCSACFALIKNLALYQKAIARFNELKSFI